MESNIDDIFKESDIITIHVPLNNNTRKMIGKPEFLKMKTSCIFINASRGEVVDELDLHDALKMGHLKAAAIDVFEKEPPDKNNPLFSLKNIIISPHNAALTEESMINMSVDSAQGIVDFFNGNRPKYVVNPEVIL
jgi:D-3-phosphoglycerate dehydrogenase